MTHPEQVAKAIILALTGSAGKDLSEPHPEGKNAHSQSKL
jgi:hypothetical protein